MSTYGTTPPGVATTISCPASVSARYGAANSSAQYPVACLVPSLSVQYAVPVITNRSFAMGLPLCVK